MACKFLFKCKQRFYSPKMPHLDFYLRKFMPDLQIVRDSRAFFVSENKLLEQREAFFAPTELFRQCVALARSLGNRLGGLNLVSRGSSNMEG